jgi:phosphohistidine phosphatase SixA
MELYILRHGDAENGTVDSQRQLSDQGRQQVISQAMQHSQGLASIESVITSPLIRARQTAELVMSQTAIHCPPQIADCLLPNAQVAAVEQLLEKNNSQRILLVGHLPLLDQLINYFVGDSVARMATASLASLSMNHAYRGLATLNWIHHAN